MPNITCAEAAQWPIEYDVDNGNVRVSIWWDWDGVSQMPDCDGPLTGIRVVNASNTTYYVNLPAKKKGLRNLEIPPGTDTTYTPQQLKQAGLNTLADTRGVQPHTEPLNLRA